MSCVDLAVNRDIMSESLECTERYCAGCCFIHVLNLFSVYHAWNKKTRLLRSLTSSSVSLGSEEPVLWPSTETSHFRAMIRALLWGRYSAIVAEFQYNGLAPDLTHWCGRVHAAAPHCNPLHERTHSDLIALSVFVQLFICVHVR